MKITQTERVKPGVYRLANPDEGLREAVITVEGKDIVVDFTGVTLEGSAPTSDPDKCQGLGVLVKGENVTIRGLKARGYKVALMAKDVKGLKLYNCDFSYNWRARLLSDTEKENEADWMSYHHNEADEWLRYGAGAYLSGCAQFEVKNLRVTGGQCGLMLNRCDEGLVWNCDLSFNSGLGLGMYRSTRNKVMHNKMDWCVRGYSHGVYNRGQDSAGILVFEQCSNNVFAYNSATHGGDGFFLWAGQHTMDTGEGGCNDNLLYGNDFSHSPANAIEATFSRNKFVNNKLIDSWHGVWGGYSYDTVVMANVFGLNGESIAIEHGQKNLIAFNTFRGDTVGVYLWQNTSPPDPNWGYPKHRDTANTGTTVRNNLFQGVSDTALILGPGQNITVRTNAVEEAARSLAISGEQKNVSIRQNAFAGMAPNPVPPGVEMAQNDWGPKGSPPPAWMSRGGNSNVASEPKDGLYLDLFKVPWSPLGEKPDAKNASEGMPADLRSDVVKLAELWVKPLANGKDPYLPETALQGRRYILMGEWGPYDFRRPLLWRRGPDRNARAGSTGYSFEILGPKGKWRIASKSPDLSLSADEGDVPGFVTASWPSGAKKVDISLEYIGQATVDERGVETPAGQPVKFGWSKTYLPIDWSVRFWPWGDGQDPRTKLAEFDALLATKPVAEYKATELAFATSGSPYQAVPADHFATAADGTFEVEAGEYDLNVTTDDGARVWLDDKLLVDEWHWQGPTLYTRRVKLEAGRHSLRVRHFEIDGYTTLRVEIKPAGR